MMIKMNKKSDQLFTYFEYNRCPDVVNKFYSYVAYHYIKSSTVIVYRKSHDLF